MPRENRAATRSEIILVARVRTSNKLTRFDDDPASSAPEYGVAIHDLSMSGLSFLTDQSFPKGCVVEMRILWGDRELLLYGVAKYERRFNRTGIHIIGVQFIRLPVDNGDLEALQTWLREQQAATE
jgi:hypothetical protein